LYERFRPIKASSNAGGRKGSERVGDGREEVAHILARFQSSQESKDEDRGTAGPLDTAGTRGREKGKKQNTSMGFEQIAT